MTTCLSAELQSSAQGMALVPRKPGVLLSVPLLSPNHSCLVRDIGNARSPGTPGAGCEMKHTWQLAEAGSASPLPGTDTGFFP